MTAWKSVELACGPIEYLDSGEGPTLVFLHGAMKDARVWREVVARLEPHYRCIRPTMPLGAHRLPMRPGADLTVAGLARLTGEFLTALDLREVTLIQNHWGAAQVMLAEGQGERLSRLVLTACEAFDNYPPGPPGRLFARAAKVPGALDAMALPMRARWFRTRMGAADVSALRPLPRDLADEWQLRFTDRAVRGDLATVLRDSYLPADLARWAKATESFPGPALVVWAGGDRLMPREHGPRLAASFPHGTLVEIADSATCLPLDQPVALADAISEFLAATGPAT
ncbi:alpha/beta hydrolase [Nocardia yamanashiensis]|uniref:alpha/beta fold hydrolase n=1 Tax=Nocardia yamanashiensis TaxID=209247 RepID=UPI001E33B574|nr:alpha/beta hydrolase [Nocardia yamanashiensis]UGT43190.1 alpha/beta hydrolase [Nocardia yamanashiensis]